MEHFNVIITKILMKEIMMTLRIYIKIQIKLSCSKYERQYRRDIKTLLRVKESNICVLRSEIIQFKTTKANYFESACQASRIK